MEAIAASPRALSAGNGLRAILAGVLTLALFSAVLFGDRIFAETEAFVIPEGASANLSTTSLSGQTGERATFTLKAAGSSGQYGQVVVTGLEGGKSKVTLHLSAALPGVLQAAALHRGKCPRVGEQFLGLNPVSRGHSETIVDVPYIDLVDRMSFAVIVSKSMDEAQERTACAGIRLPLPPGGR